MRERMMEFAVVDRGWRCGPKGLLYRTSNLGLTRREVVTMYCYVHRISVKEFGKRFEVLRVAEPKYPVRDLVQSGCGHSPVVTFVRKPLGAP